MALLSDLEGEEAIGDVQVEFVPELGTIVARGSKRDLDRVDKEVRELEELAKAPAESASDEESAAPRAVATAGSCSRAGDGSLSRSGSLAEMEVDFEKQRNLAKGAECAFCGG